MPIINPNEPLMPEAPPPPMSAVDAFSEGADRANAEADAEEAKRKVRAQMKEFMRRYDESREFDSAYRKQFIVDRNYASGRALLEWAVSTNIIGAGIDVLVSTLYARDPDVSVRKAPHVDESGTEDLEAFARTLELVISRLWKSAKLKQRMRKVIRSVLTVGQGWLKVVPIGQMKPDPLVKSQLNTLEDNVRRVQELRRNVAAQQNAEGNPASDDELARQEAELQASMASLEKSLERMVYEGLAIDFVKPDDIQVSVDVETLEDYEDASTIWHQIFYQKDEVLEKFPELREGLADGIDPLAGVTSYYRKPQRRTNTANGNMGTPTSIDGANNPGSAPDQENYSIANGGEGNGPEYVRVVEGWDRRDNHIYTTLSGITDKWARKPYQPAYASERFYGFFYFSIYEVDNERFPQSMSWRGAKLQDEYSATRSSFRLARERSIPGIIFNSGAIDDTQAKKLEGAVRNELIPIKFADQETDVKKVFTDKPVPNIDPRLYDTTAIVQDFERTFGIQEAQQQVSSNEITATEAEIQQSGFKSRTDTSRDTIEAVLTAMAKYTAEVAIQCIKPDVASRIAGPTAMWPHGMSIEDIMTMVDVDITAGTTGKPRNRGDREAWTTVMPLILETQDAIAMLQVQPGQEGLVAAKKETLRETMRRFGDDTDTDRFLPKPMNPMLAAAALAATGVPPGQPPGAPPQAGAPASSAPATPQAGALPGSSAPQPIPKGVSNAV